MDIQGNAYVSGYFSGDMDFDPGSSQQMVTSSGGEDIFVQKLDSSGNYNWFESYGGTGNECFGYGIATNGDYISATGSFSGGIDLNPNGGGALHSTTGYADVFVVNYVQCNLNLAIEEENGIITAEATGVDYQWVDCDNNFSILSGEISQSFEPNQNGNYAVIISDGACVDTSTCVQVNSVSLLELPRGEVSIFPNPVQDELFIQLHQNTDGVVQIFDLKGRLLKRLVVGQQPIQLGHLAPGMYIVQIKMNQAVYQEILIKH